MFIRFPMWKVSKKTDFFCKPRILRGDIGLLSIFISFFIVFSLFFSLSFQKKIFFLNYRLRIHNLLEMVFVLRNQFVRRRQQCQLSKHFLRLLYHNILEVYHFNPILAFTWIRSGLRFVAQKHVLITNCLKNAEALDQLLQAFFCTHNRLFMPK